jgi:hypothetical protein
MCAEVEAFLAGGGRITKIAAGASSGIRSKDWKRMVRGEPAEIELAPSPRNHTMHLVAGFGSKAS